MDSDEPSVDVYNAETGDHVATGTAVVPDLSRWQLVYRKLKFRLTNRPKIWIMATGAALLVAELVA